MANNYFTSRLFLFSLFLILVVSSSVATVAAAPPFLSADETSNGLIINMPTFHYMKQNSQYTFYWYVQNQTTGEFMTNATISCALKIYKDGINGMHIADVTATFDGVEEFSASVNKNNFSTCGDYAKLIKCNSTRTGVGGIFIKEFLVTPDGRTPQNIFENSTLIIILLAGVGILIFALKTENVFLAYISGATFTFAGMYTMFYGFSGTADLYTRGISSIILGIGLYLIFSSAFSDKDDWGEGEKDDTDYFENPNPSPTEEEF